MRLKSLKVKRNDPCPCRSGKKLKNCCLRKVREFQVAIEAGLDPQTIVVNRILGEPSEP